MLDLHWVIKAITPPPPPPPLSGMTIRIGGPAVKVGGRSLLVKAGNIFAKGRLVAKWALDR